MAQLRSFLAHGKLDGGLVDSTAYFLDYVSLGALCGVNRTWRDVASRVLSSEKHFIWRVTGGLPPTAWLLGEVTAATGSPGWQARWLAQGSFGRHPRYKEDAANKSAVFGWGTDLATDTRVCFATVHVLELKALMVLGHVKHCNVEALLDVRVAQRCTLDAELYLCAVLRRGRHQLERLLAEGRLATEDHQCCYLVQLCEALRFLHLSGIVHGRVCPAAIFLTNTHELCLCDYRRATASGEAVDVTACGFDEEGKSWCWSPESIVLDVADYTWDVWAAGCVLANLVLQAPLFPAANFAVLLRAIGQLLGAGQTADLGWLQPGQRPNEASMFVQRQLHRYPGTFEARFADAVPGARELLRAMLTWSPRARCTAEEALAGAWLRPWREEEARRFKPTPFDWSVVKRTTGTGRGRELAARLVRGFNPEWRPRGAVGSIS